MVNQTTEHDYVDLGLSVCWATCNIGASTPYEHGGLYAWGELDAKKSYNGWATYKWCNGTSRTMTKYNNYSDYGYNGFVDDIKVLDPVDDIASVMWGDGWRMPTRDEFNELINNCTWEWISIDDIEGYYVTSCVPGFTDRSIFIPASGGDWGGGARRTMHQGFYRSAEACVIPARTVILYFNKDTYGMRSALALDEVGKHFFLRILLAVIFRIGADIFVIDDTPSGTLDLFARRLEFHGVHLAHYRGGGKQAVRIEHTDEAADYQVIHMTLQVCQA